MLVTCRYNITPFPVLIRASTSCSKTFPGEAVDRNYSYRFLINNELETYRFARKEDECLKS